MLKKFILSLCLGVFVYAAGQDPIIDLKILLKKNQNSKEVITRYVQEHSLLCETPEKKYQLSETAVMCRTNDDMKSPSLFVGIDNGIIVLASDTENLLDCKMSSQFECVNTYMFRRTCFNKNIKGSPSHKWSAYLSQRFPLDNQ